MYKNSRWLKTRYYQKFALVLQLSSFVFASSEADSQANYSSSKLDKSAISRRHRVAFQIWIPDCRSIFLSLTCRLQIAIYHVSVSFRCPFAKLTCRSKAPQTTLPCSWLCQTWWLPLAVSTSASASSSSLAGVVCEASCTWSLIKFQQRLPASIATSRTAHQR